MPRTLIGCFALLAVSLPIFAAETLASPDGGIVMTFDTNPKGQLVYSIALEGKPLFRPSALGLELEGVPALGLTVRIQSATHGSEDETYEMPHGKSNPIRNRYNSLRMEIAGTGEGDGRFALEARAYDDGVAFRYVVPEGAVPSGQFRLVSEKTEFGLVKDSTAYTTFIHGWGNNYEDPHVPVHVAGIGVDQLVGLPVLLNVHGVAWVAITEAALEDYAGMYLRRRVTNGFLVDLPPNREEEGLRVVGALPHRTPWRAIMIAGEVGSIIESNMVVNLNPPSEIADTSWIKPGKSSWNWWFGRVELEPDLTARMDMPTMKHLVDFSAEAGFEYMLVDAGWSDREDILKPTDNMNIEELVDYGRDRNVGIWIWLNWTAVDRQMEQAFPLYERWGVKGVKVDYMDRDDQWMVDWYHRVVRLAAEHHLMVDFHGAYKPTGIRRTWPNLVTREGVQGQEYSKWSFGIEPEHNVTIAFTRLLAGPMDFTPGGFDNVTRNQFVHRSNDPMVMGTRAHNLAMFVVYESPFLVVCDHPSAYRGQPGYEFLKAVPAAAWDETHVLNALPGDYITIARRRGDEWFVGTMNDWTARDLEIPLSFLGEGAYISEIYSDGADADANPKSLSIERSEVTAATTLKVRLAPGGGQGIRIAKK